MDKKTDIRAYAKRVGGLARLAEQLATHGRPITIGAISQWKVVPSGRVLAVEKITGWSRHEQRPDVFGPKPLRK